MKSFTASNHPVASGAIVTVMLLAFAALTIDGFTSAMSLRAMLVLAALLGIAAAGQTVVVIVGGIDLSVPFVIGFANVMAAELTGRGWSFLIVMPLVLLLGALIGAASGTISVRAGVHPLIVTLGVGTIVQGLVLLWTRGYPSGSSPDILTSLVSIGSTLGPLPLPPLALFWLFLGVGMWAMLRLTVFGRSIYAAGSSPAAAQMALVPRARIWTSAFAISGSLSALTGMLLLGFTGAASGTVGDQYLFLSIAAVVVGGTSLLGGRGSYAGTVVGALMLTVLTTLMIGSGLTSDLVQAVLGVLIIAVVTFYGRQEKIRNLI
jgi:ribose transport system permease protein